MFGFHGPRQETGATLLTLFASGGTLICCALPILLVSIGLGAAVVGLTTTLPFLITLSQHKGWIFAGSALLLAASGWMLYRPGRSCPADPALAQACERAWIWNRRLFSLSLGIWIIGAFAAFLLLPLRRASGW